MKKKLKTFFNICYNKEKGRDKMANQFILKLRKYFDNKRGKFDNISEMFHFKYYKKMFNKKIVAVLSNGDVIRGIFNAEIPEVDSIQIGKRVIKIEDIDMVNLIKD